MEAIRRIQTVADGEVHLQLPERFWGQEVEIIVLSSSKQTTPLISQKKSLRGRLKHYAKPELITEEQGVWEASVDDKNEHR